ncbi:hypothetical protein ILYODFUR_036141, partial [Ilyodon furcidens]
IPNIHWVCQPENLCDANLLSPDDHTEELKFSFLSLPRILKRGSCVYRWWFPTTGGFLPLVVSRDLNESYQLCPAEILGPLNYLLHPYWKPVQAYPANCYCK